jgi:hypothetical protein
LIDRHGVEDPTIASSPPIVRLHHSLSSLKKVEAQGHHHVALLMAGG